MLRSHGTSPSPRTSPRAPRTITPMKSLVLLMTAALLSSASAAHPVIPLWPEGVPGAKAGLGPEKYEDGRISNV